VNPPDSEIFLGFDPGGNGKYGVALLSGTDLSCCAVETTATAFEWAKRGCGLKKPVAAGIDTLLHWSDRRSGWRAADCSLRAKYPTMKRSVVAPSSLYGAMVIGGMALAMRCRKNWQKIILNETHPKVLFYHFFEWSYGGKQDARAREERLAKAIRCFEALSGLSLPSRTDEHAFDAALSAWATREGCRKGWDDLADHDRDLVFPIEDGVHYFWPMLETDAR
jgi:Protein of unknown function (DUF429)